jgi:signal transduction histidine kinase
MDINECMAKILIVDDQLSARETLRGFLTGQNYQLAFAHDGSEALEKIATWKPDLVILDIMMPNLNGFEVCQRMKADEKWRYIPVILVTALDSKEDLARGLEMGADDFLQKPVNSMELRARVRSMLRLKRQQDELEVRNQQLRKAMQMREDLAGMIVHDMRAPLTTILGFSELILVRNNISPEYNEILKKIHNQSQRLNWFLDDFLVIAKMEAGELLLNPTPTDVNGLLQAVVDSYSPIAQSKQVEFLLELAHVSAPVVLDTKLFHRVLDNLVSNALKFSPSRATISLQIEYLKNGNGSHLNLKVIDEGPGVPSEAQERIFNKFEIVDLKKNGVPQVGLGLAFCKLVVEAHGGQISVEANNPCGSIFTVKI